MNIYLEKINSGVQIRISDDDSKMQIHDKLIEMLDKKTDVTKEEKLITFETPISNYIYKSIPFSVLFDEMVDETFIFVGEDYNYSIIEKLLHGILTE